jgi:DNA-directed RNA polymerase subunit RPC12/RpoP
MDVAFNRLLVSSQCPSCGARLDFGEGSNGVACEFCRSTLLVTGRGRVLAYHVAPRVEAQGAFGAARFAEPTEEGPVRVGRPRLFFLPYYRFRALEFRWQRPDPAPRPFAVEPPDGSSDYRPAISIEQVFADLYPGPDDVEFRERHVEKNFLAVDFPGIELYSLGLRPTALKLSLFGRGSLEAKGTVVAPSITPEAAIERGERLTDAYRVAYRQLVGRLLSLVYFPFWFVSIERPGRRALTVVDAVSQSVVLRNGPADALDRLQAVTEEPSTLGFRPLACPNCGWALALRPEDVIFYCTTCSRAWRILGDDMLETPHRIVAGPAHELSPNSEHLPLWHLRGEIEGSPRSRFLAPAFRCRRLKTLADLAARLARTAPSLLPAEHPPRQARGVYLEEADGAALVLFAEIGEDTERFDEVERRARKTLRVEQTELVWVPFGVNGYSYLEPFTGTAIPKNLVL